MYIFQLPKLSQHWGLLPTLFFETGCPYVNLALKTRVTLNSREPPASVSLRPHHHHLALKKKRKKEKTFPAILMPLRTVITALAEYLIMQKHD